MFEKLQTEEKIHDAPRQLMIDEVDNLKILGFHFDRKLT